MLPKSLIDGYWRFRRDRLAHLHHRPDIGDHRFVEAIEQLVPRLAPEAGWVSLRPRQFDTLAIVHRAGAVLSPAARLMIELATRRIQAIAEPIASR